jgi:hypothetical protein
MSIFLIKPMAMGERQILAVHTNKMAGMEIIFCLEAGILE